MVLFSSVLKSGLCCLALSQLSLASGSDNDEHSMTFEEYAEAYGKFYDCEHKRERAQKEFEKNMALIKAHNEKYEAGKTSYEMGVNQFTDGTKIVKGLRFQKNQGEAHSSHEITSTVMERGLRTVDLTIEVDVDMESLPEEVDWKHALTPVKEQGMCGSCFAVASVETLEAHAFLATGKKSDLSIQQVLDCIKYDDELRGCSGGVPEQVYDVVQRLGLATEWTYPYESGHGDDHHKCRFNSSKATKPGKPRTRSSSIRAGTPASIRIEGYAKVQSNSIYATMHALATKGPMTVVVAADDNWSKYKGGVLDTDYTNATDPKTLALDHAVQLVGYGVDKKHGPYWTVRNSWGLDFGENGFIRLRRETDPAKMICKHDKGTNSTACGASGVLQLPTYPVGVTHARSRVTPH